MNPGACFLFDPEWDSGGYPESCPFNSRRAGLARNMAASLGLLGGAGELERKPEPAGREDLLRFHVPEYLDALEQAGRGHLPPESFAMGIGTPDCPVFRNMYEYAAATAGGTRAGARMILRNDVRSVFNPAGGYHHARPNMASGFCYINDIVLAALEFAAAGKRALFLDLDVHHCDGVQAAFYESDDVMTISMHESGRTLFPGTGFEDEIGIGRGRGYSVNIPLPVGTYDGAYLFAFRSAALPLIEAYAPDAIIVELGMDTLAGDPLAHLHLTNNVHAELLPTLTELGKPILATGGGGYNVENTVRGWVLCWSVLAGYRAEDASAGFGGVMLENAEWQGGLRDRTLLSDSGRRAVIDAEIRATVARVRAAVFPLHGLKP